MRNIKKLRLKTGKTQEEFAKRFNLNRLQYTNIENGKYKGSPSFWLSVQKKFNLSNQETLELMEEYDERK